MWLSSTSQAYMYTVFDSIDSELDFRVIKKIAYYEALNCVRPTFVLCISAVYENGINHNVTRANAY